MTASRASGIGSQPCREMSSSDRRILSAFHPCRGGALIEEDGTHYAGTDRADRWALPQVHAIIGSFLVRYIVDDSVPSEDDAGCGSSTDSNVDR